MSSFNQGLSGMVSLGAVNEWIGVINSNLGGSNRTAYKATRVKFGGGVVNIERDPRTSTSGLQIPDSTLTIDNTRIDFGQGTIIQDGELTHLAISGDGFFAINDGSATFFTRDGDFRWSVLNNQTILTTAGGLTVLTNTGASATPIARVGSGTTFAVTITTVTGATASIGVFRFANNQALKFSRFGSTVFDASNAVGAATIASLAVTDVEITQSALESSNAALNDTLPELSLAQKLFSAVSKIINVNNSDLDVTINLIR